MSVGVLSRRVGTIRIFDPYRHGLAWDNVADDSAAIMAAAAEANAAGGGVVELPPGTGFIGSAAVGLSLQYEDVVIRGALKNATTLRYTGSGKAVASHPTSALTRRAGLESLTVDTRGAGAGHIALEVDNILRGSFRHLWLNGLGVAGTGLKLVGSAAKSTYFNEFEDVDITATTTKCVDIGDGCNANRFLRGVWEGSAKALSMMPVTTSSGTNYFEGVAMQTTHATIVELGGAGAAASDNQFEHCRLEPGGGPANFVVDATAVRNHWFSGSWSNGVTLVGILSMVVPAWAGTYSGISFVAGGARLLGDVATGVRVTGSFKAGTTLHSYNGGGTSITVADDGIYQQGTNANANVVLVPKGTGVVDVGAFPIRMSEIADPAAPAANKGVVYARDVAGKTQVAGRFPTGAVQPVSTEP